MAIEPQKAKTTFSKPVAYGTLATATVGAVGLTILAPSAVMAGMGSVSTSSAVFVTPVWRMIKRINELYNDTGHYLKTDYEHFRNKYIHKIDLAAAGAAQEAASYTPHYSRKAVYGTLGVTAFFSGGLLIYAPTALAAGLGAVAVSGASFTKPVIDLVKKVNDLYVDTYNYIKGDLSKAKKLKINLPEHQHETNEIDQSISAPVSSASEKATRSKLATYAILAGGAVATAFVAIHAPVVLVAALGTVMGDAISYTQPVLKFVKKINAVYERAERQVASDLKIAEELGIPTMQQQKPNPLKYLNVTRPVAYAIMGGIAVGVGLMAVYAPSLLAAGIGSIAGSASSFTSPVLKQVGKVNDFYIDAGNYLREDWKRIFKPRAPQVELTQEKAAPAPEQQPAPVAPKTEAPQQTGQELTQKQSADSFNKSAKPVVEEVPQPQPAQTQFNKKALPKPQNDNTPEKEQPATAQSKQKPQPPVQKP